MTEMNGNTKIGVALVGGYLLGRTKKAKMAVGLGMYLAGKKLNFDPKQLGKLVADSPVLGSLNDQVRKELVGATKTAATKALTQRASGLADSLHRRTAGLEDPDGKQDRDQESGEQDDQDGPDAEDRAADGDEDTDEGEEKPAPRRKAATAKKTAKKTAGSGGSQSSRAGGSSDGGARKKSASTARKTTSGARRTASSATRKERGGDNG
ncbi:hypothetical protein AB0J21_20350 [Streptomyces sp. NPDC049954]|uniref:hypothetical protein n=1 Tax=Streptomyces sp. NPDC049954 TaxID=3155779 RepID=UPI0034130E9A